MWFLLIVIGLGTLYYYLRERMRHFEKLGVPQIKPSLLIGNMGPVLHRKRSFAEHLKECYAKLEGVRYYGMFNFMTPLIVIRDPELIKEIGIKHFDCFSDRTGMTLDEVDKMFSKNLTQLRGDKWRATRSILSPTFTGVRMRGMFNLVNDTATDFNDCLAANFNSEDIDMKQMFGRYTTDVIATAVFGIKVNSLLDKNNDFYVIGKEAVNFEGWKTLVIMLNKLVPSLMKLFKIKVFPEKGEKFFLDLVENNVRLREKEGIVRPDMLQLMIQSNVNSKTTKMSIDDMASQAFSFFFGGFDTTSSTICFAAHEIAHNPEVQKKLIREIRANYERVKDKNNGYDVIRDLSYLDAVVRETLRLHPAGFMIDRRCSKSFKLPPACPGGEEVTVNPGDSIGFPIQAIHHDPSYFSEPEKFIPERFLRDDGTIAKEMLDSTTYLPFGLGPRICIGIRFALMEVKLVLFHLLARCELIPSSKTEYPVMYSKTSALLMAENGFWLKLKAHSNE